MAIKFFTSLSASRVDAENGIVHDVSVITSGVKAKGHELHTDATTLEQMCDCGMEAEQIPVKWNHKTGADSLNGYLTNFHIKKSGKKTKLLADWHLLKSHEKFEQAIELATRMPKNVGLSAVFKGDDETVNGKTFARCDELLAVDLVAHPAANPDGMFSDPSVDNDADVSMKDKIQKEQEPTLKDVMTALAAIQENQTALQAVQDDTDKRLKKFDEFIEAVNEAVVDPDPEADPDPEEDPADADPKAKGNNEFSAMGKRIKSLEARLAAADAAGEDAEVAAELADIETKFNAMHQSYTELEAERDAILHLLEANGIKITAEGESLNVSVEGGDPGASGGGNRGGKKLSEFDEKVNAFAAGADGEKALSRPDAIRKAIREFPDVYKKHLEAKGVGFKTL